MQRRTWRIANAMWFYLLLLYLPGCGESQSFPAATPLAPPEVHVTKLTDGFSLGVKMALLDDGRILLTEKETGLVRLIDPDFVLQPQPVLDVAVNYASERGLLGIAAHPNFSDNRYVYIYYVASNTSRDNQDPEAANDIRVARFRLAGATADGPPQTLITLPARPGPYHNGGCIRFGPDGKLYVSLGELNRHANVKSQLKGNPRGKILRYNDDGTIPPDNPFGPDNPIDVYGIRNAFGFAFEKQGRQIFVSDNGPKGHDRLSRALPGENLGWPLIWGKVDTWYEHVAAWWIGKRFRPPLWESFAEHTVPTAVQVLPNDLYGPGMHGRVIMSAFGPGHVLQFSLDNSERNRLMGIGRFAEGFNHVVDLQIDAEGRLYVLTLNALYRVDPVSRAAGR